MRRCVYKHFERNATTRKFEESTREGIFVQYGSDFEEFESGAGNYTCLVVELDTGEVELVHPANVIRLTPAGKKVTAESPVNNTQQTQPAISQLYSRWCAEKKVAGGVRSYVKDFVAWAEKQQAGA